MTRAQRPRAALYARLSEEGESEKTAEGDSASIGRQKADLRDLAEREGWDVTTIYTDDGISGRRDRANAERAIADLAAARVDVLAVWKWDRWSRQGVRAVASLMDALAANPEGLFVAHLDELRSDTPAWEVAALVLARQAEQESENTSRRVSRAIRENRRAGRYTGGPTPIGYQCGKDSQGRSVLVVDPHEAAALESAARAIIEGASVYAATQALNAGPVCPRRAASWSVQAVTQALTGTSIVGRVRVDGELLRNADGSPRQVFPPAIPLDVWQTVRAVLASRRLERSTAGPGRREPRLRLLSGILHCGSCGGRLYVRSNSGANVSYRCGAVSNGRPCVKAASVTAVAIETFVTDRVLKRLGGATVTVPLNVEVDTAALEGVLEAIDETACLFRVKGADYAALSVRMRGLQEQRAELEAAAAALPRIVNYERGRRSFADLWDVADVSARRDHLARVVDRIEVHPAARTGGYWHPLDDDRVRIKWRGPDLAGASDLARRSKQ